MNIKSLTDVQRGKLYAILLPLHFKEWIIRVNINGISGGHSINSRSAEPPVAGLNKLLQERKAVKQTIRRVTFSYCHGIKITTNSTFVKSRNRRKRLKR